MYAVRVASDGLVLEVEVGLNVMPGMVFKGSQDLKAVALFHLLSLAVVV